MKNEKNLNDILNEVKEVDNGINNIIVPILKDTIKDGNTHNRRLFTLCIIQALIIVFVVFISLFLVYKQNVKYEEFLSQFEFGYEEVTQDLDTHEGGDITGATINNN